MPFTVAHIRPELLLPIILVPVVWFGAQCVQTLLRRDRFLVRLFSEHRDLWNALGGPRGWQWAPPRGARPPANSPSIYFDWFSASEPSWLSAVPELLSDYRMVRAGIRRWTFVAMPTLVLAGIVFFSLIKLTE
jgi:hypothetical protein